MKLPTRPKQRLAWVLGFGAINLALAAWLSPPPPERVEALAAEDAWSLPELPAQVDPAPLQQQLRRLKPWGDDTAAASSNPRQAGTKPGSRANPLPQAWRFAGVVEEGRRPYLLLQDPAGKIQRYATSDPLPQGQRIIELYADRVELEHAEGRETWYLYPAKPP